MRFLRKNEAAKTVGLHPVHIMRLAKAGKFPAPVQIGPGAVGFVADEINDWMLERLRERDEKPGEPRGGSESRGRGMRSDLAKIRDALAAGDIAPKDAAAVIEWIDGLSVAAGLHHLGHPDLAQEMVAATEAAA